VVDSGSNTARLEVFVSDALGAPPAGDGGGRARNDTLESTGYIASKNVDAIPAEAPVGNIRLGIADDTGLTSLLNYDGWIDDVVFYRGTY